MGKSNNSFCRAIVKNPNTKSPIVSFELITVREYINHNGGTYISEVRTASEFLDNTNVYDEPFYRIFGVYRNIVPKQTRFIADFFHIDEAKKLLYDLTGEDIQVISY
jgi:hypothetical protein